MPYGDSLTRKNETSDARLARLNAELRDASAQTILRVAMIREWNKEFLDKDWNAYIINDRNTPIEMTMVVSKGYDKDRKSSTMRHGIGDMQPKSFRK